MWAQRQYAGDRDLNTLTASDEKFLESISLTTKKEYTHIQKKN